MKTEKELSQEMGLDRKHLVKMRKEGVIAASSWIKVSNQIVYHEEGEHEIRNIIQRELCVDELPDPLPEPVEKEMIVTAIPKNNRMVLCGDVKVKVHSNQNFRKGMKLTARPPISTDSRMWVLVGRSPRWKGKW